MSSPAYAIARQRAGRRRDDESPEEYAARVEEHLPHGSRVQPLTPDAVSAVNERRQRALRQGSS